MPQPGPVRPSPWTPWGPSGQCFPSEWQNFMVIRCIAFIWYHKHIEALWVIRQFNGIILGGNIITVQIATYDPQSCHLVQDLLNKNSYRMYSNSVTLILGGWFEATRRLLDQQIFVSRRKALSVFFLATTGTRTRALYSFLHTHVPNQLTYSYGTVGSLNFESEVLQGYICFSFLFLFASSFFFFFVMGRIYTRPIWHSYSILHWYCTRLHSIICGYVFKKERVKTV